MWISVQVGHRCYGENDSLNKYMIEVRPHYMGQFMDGSGIYDENGEFQELGGFQLEFFPLVPNRIERAEFTLSLDLVNALHELIGAWNLESQRKPNKVLRAKYFKVDEGMNKFAISSAREFESLQGPSQWITGKPSRRTIKK